MNGYTWRSLKAAQVEIPPELYRVAQTYSLTDPRFHYMTTPHFDTVFDVARLAGYIRDGGDERLDGMLRTLQQILMKANDKGYKVVQFIECHDARAV